MKIVYIDIETLGLNPHNCDLLQVGMLIDNPAQQKPYEQLPKFLITLKQSEYTGNSFAFNMHKKLLERIAANDIELNLVPTREHIIMQMAIFFDQFYTYPTKIILGGKNIGSFDIPFLKVHGIIAPNGNLPGDYKYHHRFIDPAAFFLRLEDEVPPSLEECLKRAGIDKPVEHTALADCWDCAQLVRKHYNEALAR